ncbi:MAG TPA: fumarylacetoacetate hydrolase family protein [Candidatus Acidoferrum sp.]|nr:fumarylacetoacetate hydrolase family protein [Candidatus Acidoferrum sp.]
MSVEDLARELKAAQDERRPLVPPSSRVSGFDTKIAYEVARLIHEARLREGARPVGRKIGFTNRDIWPVYGVFEPIWAHVYDTTVARLAGPRATCRIGRFVPDPRIEPEIVLHFRTAPPSGDDLAAVLACVDWIAHGFEIVQSHFPDWKFQAADSIADSSLHGTLLVGEPRGVDTLDPDLAARLERFTIALECDGAVRDRGRGANALGSPLAAVAHLTSVLSAQRAPAIQAGELVTTGTLTQAPLIHAGETWSTTLDGIDLPGLRVTFEA